MVSLLRECCVSSGSNSEKNFSFHLLHESIRFQVAQLSFLSSPSFRIEPMIQIQLVSLHLVLNVDVLGQQSGNFDCLGITRSVGSISF